MQLKGLDMINAKLLQDYLAFIISLIFASYLILFCKDKVNF